MRYLLIEKISKIWEFRIASERQENGLFGVPINCTEMGRIPFDITNDLQIKISALCVAVSEDAPGVKFRFYPDKESAVVILSNESGIRRIRYSNYEFKNNALIWVGDKFDIIH